MAVEGVFIAIGYVPASDLAKKLGLELSPEGYIKGDSRHSTKLQKMFRELENLNFDIVSKLGTRPKGGESALSADNLYFRASNFDGLVKSRHSGEN
ncbi:MAG: NAD(P)/FAD-dependent oxidoreductase, partial [Proteobacteria bacterium]|nr:NAD(P)/FAD-dependent oxidoreductase [Pseudomonadota bacterium]